MSRASERYLTGSVLIDIPDAASDAATVLESATTLYAEGPGPGETHGFGMEALARVNLAEARLRAGGIEAAAQVLGPVLSLPASKRIDSIPRRLSRVQAELHAPVFRGSPQARDLSDQIEEFGREAVTAGLHSLSGDPGSGADRCGTVASRMPPSPGRVGTGPRPVSAPAGAADETGHSPDT